MKPPTFACLVVILCPALYVFAEPAEEKTRYLRPSGEGYATECVFTIKRGDGWSITSVTERGANPLTVVARYDDKDRLLSAEATLGKDDKKETATVEVTNGKARVKRPGQEAQEFEVPPGVIVTSAPDWTDTFLLCRKYDRTKGGKQQFAGLWIHPTQKAQLLTFSIERLGSEVIERDGKKLELDRYAIHLRGNSPYAAWTGSSGKMIRLIPLPFKEKAGLTLEGYEKSAAGLRPSQP